MSVKPEAGGPEATTLAEPPPGRRLILFMPPLSAEAATA